MAEYTPSDDQVRTTFVEGASEDAYAMSWHEPYAEAYDRWLAAHDARVRREAAREALDGLSTWLGELAEKHPARSAHVPLMQGHITRYTTDHYPEQEDQT